MLDWNTAIRKLTRDLDLDPAREAQVVEEIGQYLDDRYADLEAAGKNPGEAQRIVLEELNSGRLAADLRPLLNTAQPQPVPGVPRRGRWMSALWQDLLYGARLLRLNPGFSLVAVLSLALGIGANTAIFQLLDAVRLRALPLPRPQELAQVLIVKAEGGRTGRFSGSHPQLTMALWKQIRDQQQGFAKLAAWGSESLNLNRGGEARYAQTLWVSGGFFDTLEVGPQLGRLLTTADDQRGCGPAGAVISDAFWRSEFGGSPSVLGRTITLEGQPFEIIGVTPARFFGVEVGENFDVALPLCVEPLVNGEYSKLKTAEAWWLATIGRLKPDWTIERAAAQLNAASSGIFAATVPPDYDPVDNKKYKLFQLGARSAASGFSSLRTQYENSLWLVLGIAGLVLLIACANLANLMMARASARQREMAVRLALGASPRRLVAQLLAESMLLACLGAMLGVGLAQVLSRVMVSFLSTASTPTFVRLTPDWRVLAFASGLALITCLMFGLLPALHSARTPPAEAMKAGGRGTTSGRGQYAMRRALVISQVALSLVLLVGALLFVRTLRNLEGVSTGFHRTNILVTDLDFSMLKLPKQQRVPFKQELLSRMRAIAGVTGTAATSIVPLSSSGWNENINVPERGVRRKIANFNQVTPDYFRTMGIPFIGGRDFRDSDTATSPYVAIVTETFVRKFLLGENNPVGKTFTLSMTGGKPDREYQIVGLVKDMKYTDMREEFTPIVFTCDAQQDDPDSFLRVVIRSEIPMEAVTESVKRATAEVNPAIVLKFRVFETIVREGLLRERLMATLSGFFGFLAVVLAMVGLYGVISYMVVRRKNEIGIRIALGADRIRILRMILQEAAGLLGVGLAVGTLLALIAGLAASTFLYGLRPSDPFTFVLAGISLSAVAIAASILPARRASKLDPMQALREE